MAGSGRTKRLLYSIYLGLGIAPALFGGLEQKVAAVSPAINLTDQRKITNLPGHELYPQWSPDGQRIAFQDREGKIYKDGSGLKKIVNKETQSHGLVFSKPGFCWHPSGKKIIYAVDELEGKSGIFELDLKSGKEKLLVGGDGLDSPLYSPSGQHIAYLNGANWEDVSNIILYDTNTAKTRLLTNNSARNIRKQDKVKGLGWFPDSKRIAFIEGPTYGTVTRGGNLYSILKNGKARAPLGPKASLAGEEVYSFSISPDGKNILYQVWRGSENQTDGKYFTYTYDLQQNRKIILGESEDAGDLGYQQWSPDGKMSSFTLDGELYTANKKGSKTRLTKTSYGELSPAFSPDGKSIAYSSNKDGDYDLYVGKVRL